MNVLPDHSSEMDSCKYLFLREISEPRDNRLRLLIEEAAPSGAPATLKLPGLTLTGCRAIESTSASRLFEVIWDTYVAYSVRNESFASQDGAAMFSGRFFRIYSKSTFLDYVSRATFASEQYPGPLSHVGLICQNHIVDVVSTKSPAIRRLRPTANT
jgi:hypothetical protein